MDVLKVFHSVENMYFNVTDGISKNQIDFYDVKTMREMNMIIETRPRYPSTKLTFTIANITKGKTIRWFNINSLNLNGRFDIDLVLEDSQRNLLSSFFLLSFLFICF